MQRNWQGPEKRYKRIALLMLFGFFLYRIDLFFGLLTRFFGIIAAFIFGLLMALLINMPMQFLERQLRFLDHRHSGFHVKRTIALTISVVVVLAVLIVLGLVILPEVVATIERLARLIPGLLRDLEQWLTQWNTDISQVLGTQQMDVNSIQNAMNRVYSFLLGGLSFSSTVVFSAAQYIVNFVVGLVFAIYLLYSKERIKGQVRRVLEAYLPQKQSQSVQHVLSLTIESYSKFLGGQVVQAVVSSLAVWLVMLVFGFPHALLISLTTFVCAFIPIFGPYIAGLVGLLLVLTTAPQHALWFLLVYLVVQQLESSLVYPRILSNAIDIPSIWVLVAVTVGGGIMGIAGMLLFVPLAAVAYRLLRESTDRRHRMMREANADG